jgi:hypothetical protein
LIAVDFFTAVFTFIFENKQAVASDQKLTHGAGTLPHLTSAITLNLALQVPIPIGYSLRCHVGFGGRGQIGLSGWIFPHLVTFSAAEIHFVFIVLKPARDSDFLLSISIRILVIWAFLIIVISPTLITAI